MGSTIWKNLYDAVEINNIYAVTEYVEDIVDYIAERWQEGVRENFERTLRLYIQKSQRMERDLIQAEQQLPYQLGLASGFIRAFEFVYRKEREREGVVEGLAQCSGKTRQILDALYRAPEHGMQHGALADAIGSTASSLTNLMKKVLQSGAVEASRSGKNTYYMLTAAGEQYCMQQQKSYHDILFSESQLRKWASMIAEKLHQYDEAEAKPQAPSPKISAGDRIVPVFDGKIGAEFFVNSVLTAGPTKYMEVKPISIKKNSINTEPQKQEILALYQGDYNRASLVPAK